MRAILILLLSMTIPMASQSQPDNSIKYIHSEQASFKSKFLQMLMPIVGKKKAIEKIMKQNKFADNPAEMPKVLCEKYVVQVDNVNQRKVWTLKPKHTQASKTILYLHGGGYISNLSNYDWQFVEQLLIVTNCNVTVADYPLAPACNYKDTYSYIEGLYFKLLKETPSRNVVFLGNSAGGGLALGFAQKLRNDGKPQPSQIILNSPWLDITMTNPGIAEIDKKDKLLGIEGLELAGKAYAAELESTDYRVSPIYGDLTNVGKISIFIGTHDLFLPDSRKLRDKLDALNIPFNYFEYPKMFHVWIAVINLKESKHAIKQIASLINSSN